MTQDLILRREEPRNLAGGDLTRLVLWKHPAGSWWGGWRSQNARPLSLTQFQHRPTTGGAPTYAWCETPSNTLQSHSNSLLGKGHIEWEQQR